MGRSRVRLGVIGLGAVAQAVHLHTPAEADTLERLAAKEGTPLRRRDLDRHPADRGVELGGEAAAA